MTSKLNLKTLPLDALHRELGAKMAPFAGYSMPVQYSTGIIQEHKHTRTSAGLFDISHMGQIRIFGPSVAQALERLVPGELSGLPLLRQRYSVFTTENGGVLDDLMLTNAGDHFFLVVNAARKHVDFEHLVESMPKNFRIEMLEDRALLALQGPESAMILEKLVSGCGRLEFMSAGNFVLDSVECFITRCGYTGEDGFEISIPIDQAERVARKLLNQLQVAPIGLGARDTLRLEAGLCLYGHELDESTTPIEAGLGWIVARRYLQPRAPQAWFPGAARIIEQVRNGPARKRVGLLPEGRAPVREGAELLDEYDRVVGRVTSGTFSPSLQAPVAMGFVESGFAQNATRLNAVVRGKKLPVTVSPLPFVPHRYFAK